MRMEFETKLFQSELYLFLNEFFGLNILKNNRGNVSCAYNFHTKSTDTSYVLIQTRYCLSIARLAQLVSISLKTVVKCVISNLNALDIENIQNFSCL